MNEWINGSMNDRERYLGTEYEICMLRRHKLIYTEVYINFKEA